MCILSLYGCIVMDVRVQEILHLYTRSVHIVDNVMIGCNLSNGSISKQQIICTDQMIPVNYFTTVRHDNGSQLLHLFWTKSLNITLMTSIQGIPSLARLHHYLEHPQKCRTFPC